VAEDGAAPTHNLAAERDPNRAFDLAGGPDDIEGPQPLLKLNRTVAHIGATGKVGGRILEEVLRRGHTVTAISRPGKFPLRGDQLITATDGKSCISYDDYAIRTGRSTRKAATHPQALHHRSIMTNVFDETRPQHRCMLAEWTGS
jgi:hypothetical protein